LTTSLRTVYNKDGLLIEEEDHGHPARLADPDIPLDQVTGDQAGCVGGREHPMTKLYQLHELHGHRLWLDNLTRGEVIGDHPVWHRSGTEGSPARHDR
jgi:hypothetical protein